MYTIISPITGQRVPFTTTRATLSEAVKLADWNHANVADEHGQIVYTYAAPSSARRSPCYCDYSYHPQGC